MLGGIRTDMKSTLINKARECSAAVCLLVMFAVHHTFAQLVEVTAEIELISWHSKDAAGQPVENRRIYSSRCVVGTNTWLIETDFVANAKETWWFIGTNIAKHTVITKKLPKPEEQRGTLG